MQMKKFVFFRNDDVRGSLDDSLIRMTEIFIKEGVPISHGVEPANVTPEVVEWLLEKKAKHSQLIEIVQHGFDHSLNFKYKKWNRIRKGEFGGPRGFAEQLAEIQKGKTMMEDWFGDHWFRLFTFPFSSWNKEAIKALDIAGFEAVNGKMGISFPHKVLYLLGRILQRHKMLDFNISWNLLNPPGTKLFQIDTSIDLIDRIYSESSYEFLTLDRLKETTQRYLALKPNVGFVLHHRYHTTEESFQLLENLIKWLKTRDSIEFLTMESICHAFRRD